MQKTQMCTLIFDILQHVTTLQQLQIKPHFLRIVPAKNMQLMNHHIQTNCHTLWSYWSGHTTSNISNKNNTSRNIMYVLSL